MGEPSIAFLLMQLGYQAPALLVYLVAFILALVYMGRASTPCTLTLVGVGMLVVTTVGMLVVQAWLMGGLNADGHNPAAFARLMGSVGLAGSCVRAVGLGFLVAAIFVGRRPAVSGWAEPSAGAGRGGT
jgi:hypothetical protein